MAKRHPSLPDQHQNFWQLTCIQSASQSIPGILIGGVLAQQYNASIAITSICIGNLILWFIGLGVISMASKERKNAIENVRGYLGKGGGILMALILMCAFLSWYILDIQASIEALSPLFNVEKGKGTIKLGIMFGVLIAFLSMGGIKLIKWICVVSFPFVLMSIFYGIFQSKSLGLIDSWEFSIYPILGIVSLTLPAMVNLPTFFRHSNSRSDSILALTLFTIFGGIFQMSSVFTGMTNPSEILTTYGHVSGITTYVVIFATAIVLLLICLNLVNIYFASAGLEEIVPSLAGPKGYLLVGVLGTAVYAFLHKPDRMIFLENLADNFIANLGIILLASYLVTVIVKHRPRFFEKSLSFTCWFVGSMIAVAMQLYNTQNPSYALLGGICGTVLTLLLILFIEEAVWSMRKVKKART